MVVVGEQERSDSEGQDVMRCDGAQGWRWRPSHSAPNKETPPFRLAATRR